MSVYNNFAQEFSSTRQHLWDDLKPLAKYTRNGDKVLDLGCGNGRLYQLFTDKSIHYVGLDQSEELIKKAQEKFPEVDFSVGDMLELPFPDDRFDIIYSTVGIYPSFILSSMIPFTAFLTCLEAILMITLLMDIFAAHTLKVPEYNYLHLLLL